MAISAEYSLLENAQSLMPVPSGGLTGTYGGGQPWVLYVDKDLDINIYLDLDLVIN